MTHRAGQHNYARMMSWHLFDVVHKDGAFHRDPNFLPAIVSNAAWVVKMTPESEPGSYVALDEAHEMGVNRMLSEQSFSVDHMESKVRLECTMLLCWHKGMWHRLQEPFSCPTLRSRRSVSSSSCKPKPLTCRGFYSL